MKKLFVFALAGLLLTGFNQASAQTAPSLLAQIQALQLQISNLQNQLRNSGNNNHSNIVHLSFCPLGQGEDTATTSDDVPCPWGNNRPNNNISQNSTATSTSYMLTVTKSGNGSGLVWSNPAGINCGNDCNESYSSGTGVWLYSNANGGSQFGGWAGCDSFSSSGDCRVVMNYNRTVNARFDFANTPPSIDYVSGPTVLGLNALGTWTVVASDPDGDLASMDMVWGDNTSSTAAIFGSSTSQTFTHSYNTIGLKTIYIYVRDQHGGSDSASTTVSVISPRIKTLPYGPASLIDSVKTNFDEALQAIRTQILQIQAQLNKNQNKVTLAGDVSVVSAETPADATIILGNTRSALGHFTVMSANDAMVLKKMQVLISPLNNPNNPNGDAADEIPRIYLYDGDTVIGFPDGYAVMASGSDAGVASITNLNWVLPKNASKTLIVKGDVDRIGFDGMYADSGASVYTHIMSRGFEACSMLGTLACDTVITPASSVQRLVYKSKPVLSMIPYGGPLQAGLKDPVFKFKISADPAGTIEWGKVQFYVSMTGATMYGVNYQNASIDNITDGINDIPMMAIFSDSSIQGNGHQPITGGNSGYVTFLPAIPERITAGSFKDYLLKLSFGDLVTSPGAFASVSLNRSETNVSNASSYNQIEGVYNGIPSLIWSDSSASSHTTSTPDWANGLYVKAFGDTNVIHN